MMDFQTAQFDVPAAQGTIFIVLDDLVTARAIILHNLSASTLTCQYQYSTDGGGTWTDLGAAFTLGAAGGGTEVSVTRVTQAGRIRLRASGGADALELSAAVVRVSTSTLTTFPLVQL